MTSNLGSQELMDALSKHKGALTKEEVLTTVEPTLSKHFRPEFLNRLDEILPFLPLQERDMAKIVELQMKYVVNRLQERFIALSWDDAVLHYLATEGYDPTFGARPLKRLIQHEVVSKLSRALLEGKILPNTEVDLRIKDHTIVFGVLNTKNSG
jgi:ATP-dependent Clp protease ATP-binding subunit ClpB